MTENNIENIKSQMRRGVLEYCILSVLDKNDAYASELINKLKDARIIVVEGTLYPLLTRQKNQGLLAYRWEESAGVTLILHLTDKGRSTTGNGQSLKKLWKLCDILRK